MRSVGVLGDAMNEAVPIPEVGSTVRGQVVRLFEHSALLDIGSGLKGLQVSWLNKRPKINEMLQIGYELDVVVLEVEQSKQSGTYFFSLGHRQTQTNPWESTAETHPVGSRVKAKVVKLFDGGAFVEFETGFRALVPHSEVSWTETIKPKAHDFLRVGQEIEVIVQLVDKDKRTIQASYREAIENPWVTFLEKFPIGTVTGGRVVSVRKHAVFVMLPNGCIGRLLKREFRPAVISLGDAVSVVVLAYDQEQQRIDLGVRE